MLSNVSRRGVRIGLKNARFLHVHSFDARKITVSDPSFDSAEPVGFRNLFLRDACPSFVNPSTRQKSFSTGQLKADIAAEDVSVAEDGQSLTVKWNDGVTSHYPKHLLQRYSSRPARRQYRLINGSAQNIWKEPKLSDIHNCSFKDYMQDDKAFADTLSELCRTGLVFLKDVPRPEEMDEIPVEAIARRVGYIHQTFYGQSWDVVAVPEAINIAYTSVYLPLHMDLLYYESPPGVQLLHVVDNTAKGGESVFADSFAAALSVLKKDPEAYEALTRIPLTFHYPHETNHYYYQRPLIVEDASSEINSETGRHDIKVVNYSPPFQGPLDSIATSTDISDRDLDAFIRGLKMFEAYIDEPANCIELHTPENTCMVFMNRRILHGRREFSFNSSGKRFFKGTYLDIDTVQSKLRTATQNNIVPDSLN